MTGEMRRLQGQNIFALGFSPPYGGYRILRRPLLAQKTASLGIDGF